MPDYFSNAAVQAALDRVCQPILEFLFQALLATALVLFVAAVVLIGLCCRQEIRQAHARRPRLDNPDERTTKATKDKPDTGLGVEICGSAAIGNPLQGCSVRMCETGVTLGAQASACTLSGLSVVSNITGIRLDTAASANSVGSRWINHNDTGLLIEGAATANVFTGCNFSCNDGDGVLIRDGSNNLLGDSAGIGGYTASNRFANNGRDGVRVESGTGNSIHYNWFWQNSGLPIDLGGDGASANDPLDEDASATACLCW